MIVTEGNINAAALRFEKYSLILIYANSLLFSTLFTFDSIPAYLVSAVFNGSGIIMVSGLLSIFLGNLYAALSLPSKVAIWGAYYASKALFLIQSILLLVLAATKLFY
jgi:hypothetical protein